MDVFPDQPFQTQAFYTQLFPDTAFRDTGFPDTGFLYTCFTAISTGFPDTQALQQLTGFPVANIICPSCAVFANAEINLITAATGEARDINLNLNSLLRAPQGEDEEEEEEEMEEEAHRTR